MTRLCAQDIHIRFSGRDALRAVSLVTRPGEILGVIGPNGAGKTTLLRVLAGLLRPDQGSIAWGDFQMLGRDMRALAHVRAWVGQHPPADSPYTVFEMLAMSHAHKHRWFSWVPDPSVLQEALERVQARCSPSQPFAELSGGEQQLVLLARALLTRAPLLVLDEPIAHLDLRHRANLLQALKVEQQRGVTTLVSLHDLNVAAANCDRILLLHEGRAVALGTPSEVLKESILSRVFATPVWCGKHPATGKMAVEPLTS